jgi:hypothetical protein
MSTCTEMVQPPSSKEPDSMLPAIPLEPMVLVGQYNMRTFIIKTAIPV